jgi:hypothetical protein
MSMRHLLLPAMVALVATATVSGPVHAAGPDQVQGKGSHRDEAGRVHSVDVNATDSTPGVGTDANGKLTLFVGQGFFSTDVTFKADPFCVNAQGNLGAVLGTVTEGHPDFLGQTLLVRVIDNGKGKDADAFSFGFLNGTPEQAVAAGYCRPFPSDPPVPGDFDVRDRS